MISPLALDIRRSKDAYREYVLEPTYEKRAGRYWPSLRQVCFYLRLVLKDEVLSCAISFRRLGYRRAWRE